MNRLAYMPGTMGAGGRYTTGFYVTSATENDFYRGVIYILIGLVLLAIIYMFWINRK